MKIQILSDLHLEHGGSVPVHNPEAGAIVLAGDLAPYTKGLVAKLSELWATAPHILYVLGNHEFYGTEIDDTRARLADECAAVGIHLLDPGMTRIEGTRFIGATLWTDLEFYGKADEIGAHQRLRRGISDFAGAIRHHGRDFSTRESVRRHWAARRFIEEELAQAELAGETTVVITHHAPSPRSNPTLVPGRSVQHGFRLRPGPTDRAISAFALGPRPHARSGGRAARENEDHRQPGRVPARTETGVQPGALHRP